MDRTKGWSSSSACHSPPPLFTATSGGGFWLGSRALTLSLCFSLLSPFSASLFSFFPSLGFEW
uniref:Uncharacterized protein n=1 Tax=Fagus sylvatica TaxID=28930 RepID=A0A2N9HZ88_FAGSY